MLHEIVKRDGVINEVINIKNLKNPLNYRV